MNHTTEMAYKILKSVLGSDDRTIVLLGSSGVGIVEDLSMEYPGRFVDVGIMEQSIVGMSSGMAIAGMIPIIYGQSSFFIERAYEQLKVDFGYQRVGGNFILYGGSTEFGTMGATHCCPAALALLSEIPGFEVVVPGSPKEFYSLFMETYDNGNPTVYRTSIFANSYEQSVQFGKANIIKRGSKATILAIGPMLDIALSVFTDEDVTILYYSTIVPFDGKILRENLENNRLLLLEPAYQGGIMHIIAKTLEGCMYKVDFIGYPLEFITNYGYVVDNLSLYGMTKEAIIYKYHRLIA